MQGFPENQALLARERSQQNGLAELRLGHHRAVNRSAGFGDAQNLAAAVFGISGPPNEFSSYERSHYPADLSLIHCRARVEAAGRGRGMLLEVREDAPFRQTQLLRAQVEPRHVPVNFRQHFQEEVAGKIIDEEIAAVRRWTQPGIYFCAI
jgi:hypothetical protein